ncbi:hypothetical protein AVEN_134883-1 [Araneus ventricosus]|uniref:Uncharacterized protein n=1 Tax=Araneus ventricosus TaxID=182803 RepID=A0A4Y2CK38_ARAVE|nr:hypothetical protein AVEN_134883-1 [Araneus ventricosus]
MECQVGKTPHFQHYSLFAFNLGVKNIEGTREIRSLYGKGAMTQSIPAVGFPNFLTAPAGGRSAPYAHVHGASSVELNSNLVPSGLDAETLPLGHRCPLQQDGAPPHSLSQSEGLSRRNSGEQMIRMKRSIEFPPHSTDLIPMDFFL